MESRTDIGINCTLNVIVESKTVAIGEHHDLLIQVNPVCYFPAVPVTYVTYSYAEERYGHCMFLGSNYSEFDI